MTKRQHRQHCSINITLHLHRKWQQEIAMRDRLRMELTVS